MPCSPLGCHSAALEQYNHTPSWTPPSDSRDFACLGIFFKGTREDERAREQTHGPMGQGQEPRALQITESAANLRMWISELQIVDTNYSTEYAFRVRSALYVLLYSVLSTVAPFACTTQTSFVPRSLTGS